MPIAESNSERKNLTILSSTIILYNLAEGKITTSTNEQIKLKFSLVNIEFVNTQMLCYILLFVLLWFLLRYWQKMNNDDEYINKVKTEIARANYNDILVKKYFNLKKQNYPKIVNVHSKGKKIISSNYTISGGNNSSSQQEIKIKGILGIILIVWILTKTFFIRPSMSEKIIPYILFLWAYIQMSLSMIDTILLKIIFTKLGII